MSSKEETIDKDNKDLTVSGEDKEKQEKIDIKKLVAVIPPPNVVFSKQKKSVKEKRIRLSYDPSVGKDEAKISTALASELGIKDYLEISVASRKKFKFKAIVIDGLPSNTVYVNPDIMKMHGVADNSICTIRSL